MIGVLTAIPGALAALYARNELLGLFLFLLVEEAGVPLLFPGDLLIVAAGFRGPLGAGWPQVVGVAALASMLGSSLLYVVARYAGRALVLRYARVLHVDEPRLARAEQWLGQRGGLAIVAGRLVPGLRTPTTLACGVLGVPYRVFAPATAVAALLWAAAYYLVGAVARAQGAELAAILGGDVDLVFVLAGIAVLGAVLVVAVRRAMPRRPSSDSRAP